jgi:ferric-dicitrate binding protein FerR (iron transport regulator)
MADQETLYSRWLNGELSNEEIQKLQGSGEDFQLNNIIKAVEMWESTDLDLDSAYNQHITRRTKSAKVKKLIPRRSWLVAASIAFLFTCILLFNRTNDYSASFGENEFVTLADGTTVTLNDGSTLKQKWNPFSKSRTVHLLGEGLFKVTKGDEFIVLTEHGNIQVLGTEFNVRTWGNKLVVECYEGRVKVYEGVQNSILEKGESVIINNGLLNETIQIQHLEPKWLQDISDFDDEAIINVFNEIERQYDINVELSAVDKKFTGQFTHKDINAALDAICIPLGLRYKLDADEKTVNVYEM